jgi:hypothetical protein
VAAGWYSVFGLECGDLSPLLFFLFFAFGSAVSVPQSVFPKDKTETKQKR